MSKIKSHLLRKFFLVAVIFLMSVVSVNAQFSGGSGTVADPYLVATSDDLITMKDTSYLDSHFKQTADIDLSGQSNWAPIGSSDYPFTGSYDGNGKLISNLTIDIPAASNVGLFGHVTAAALPEQGGVLKNIALSAPNVTGSDNVGSLVGTYECLGNGSCNNSFIYNCSAVNATVTGNQNLGGLVGINIGGNVNECFAELTASSGNNHVGGLVGKNGTQDYPGSITESYSKGMVSGSGNYIGGLVGFNERSLIKDSYSRADVTLSGSGNYIGGFVGNDNDGEITNCYSTGSVIMGIDITSGGFAAIVGGYTSLTACYWDTDTSNRYQSAGEGTGALEARTSQEMTYPHSVHTYVGWNFPDYWLKDTDNRNNGYPYLQWQKEPRFFNVPDTGDPDEHVCNPKSYTDLGNGIVRDNVTGLEWQQATAPGTYTWEQAMNYADNLALAEYNDWRLPTIQELSTLADKGVSSQGPDYPAINTVFFPDTKADLYWSSTSQSGSNSVAYSTNFFDGSIQYYDKSISYNIRAVRGDTLPGNNFVDNGNATITDDSTGLMWQKCNYGQTWDGTDCTGSAVAQTWQQALDAVEQFNLNSYLGYTDWRLPTCNELQSLIDYNYFAPATIFPNTNSSIYWSSTVNAVNTSNSWHVDLGDGEVFYGSQTINYNVRAVRKGLCSVSSYVIEATADTGGQISPSGMVEVSEGSSQTFTITPDAGFEIHNVIVNALSVGAVSTYNFVDVQQDQTIHAEFITTDFAGGTGTEEDPFLVETAEHLNNVRNYLNSHFKQTAEIINLSSEYPNWEPIGSSEYPFNGTYNGDNKTISNLAISREASYQGLFGYIDMGSEIKNLGLVDVNIAVTGSAQHQIGTLAGVSSGTVGNCFSTGTVTAANSDEVGGLLGIQSYFAIIIDSYSSVNVEGGYFVGGLVGTNLGEIEGCHSTGSVTGTENIGGLTGLNFQGTIKDSHSTGAVTGVQAIGGLVGNNEEASSISGSYCAGNVAGDLSVGGFVGMLWNSKVTNSYSRGSVTRFSSSEDENFGGFCGLVYNGQIEYCYSTGRVFESPGVDWTTGDKGFVGGEEDFMYTFTANFFSSETSNNTFTANFVDGEASNQDIAVGAVTKSTSEMKTQNTFAPWDFTVIWKISANINDGYPSFQWQPSPTPSHNITAMAWTGGSINPEGSVEVLNGEDQGFTITPDFGYEIEEVMVDGTSVGAVSSYTFTDVQQEHSIEAYFTPDRFTITAMAWTGGSISPEGLVEVLKGTDQTFTFTPDDGFEVQDVFVNGNSIGAAADYTFENVTQDQSIEVHFTPNRFTITAMASEGGTISPDGQVAVQKGAGQTFTMDPTTGFQIVDVLVNGQSVGPVSTYTFEDVRADQTIEAVFSSGTVTITVSEGIGGSITPSGTVTLPVGGSQTFSIIPNEGYKIFDVSVNGTSVGAVSSYTFSNVTKDQSISAVFAIKTYILTATAGNGGTISPSGALSVAYGSSLTFSINANQDYQISSVSVNGQNIGAVSIYTFNNITANQTISASFAEIPTPSSYTITATAGNGGKISPSGNVEVLRGANQSFTIVPDTGYQIWDVLVNGTSIGAVSAYTFENVITDHTIEAVFDMKKYTVTATAGNGGIITPSGQITVMHGESSSFTITPDTGFEIEDVIVDGMSVGVISAYTFNNVTSDRSIEARFIRKTYTITASAGAGGTISPSGSISVVHGESRTFTITPIQGYIISSLLINGTEMAVSSTYTFNNVSSDNTIEAYFEEIPPPTAPTITASAGTGGTISPSGVIRVLEGTSQTFTITPKPGYIIASVVVNGQNVGAVSSYTFENVVSVQKIEARFAPAVKADFSSDVTSGNVPLKVSFADVSTGDIKEWQWNFGDGGISSQKNPDHTYTQPGRFTVTLTVKSETGMNTAVKADYILAGEPAPVANFTASSLEGRAPLSVSFTDTSTGNITDRQWNFGDGKVSTAQNPVNVYNTPGEYTVSLRVVGPGGSSTTVKEQYIRVNPGIFTYSISGSVSGEITEGIEIQLSGERNITVKTGADGSFAFNGLSSGRYRVTPFMSGVVFNPASRDINISISNVSGINFTAAQKGPRFGAVSATPSEIEADGVTELILTAQVFHPLGDDKIASVRANLSPIGGSITETMFYDSGTAFFTAKTTVGKNTQPGTKSIILRAEDVNGKSVNVTANLDVVSVTEETTTGGSTQEYDIENNIKGQDLTLIYSLTGPVTQTVSTRDRKQNRSDDNGGLFLQIFKPDGTPFLSQLVEIFESMTELFIPNADKGTWTYQVSNTSPTPQSFSLKTSAAGTGVVAGLVTDSKTGEDLSNIMVMTDGGGSTVTSDGYYVLLHAAGAFTIQITGQNYVPVSRSFMVQTGQTVEINAAMTEKGEDPGPCSLETVFAGTEDTGSHLSQLRIFRDTTLNKTPEGRKYIKKYYRYSPELKEMMENDKELRLKVFKCMLTIMPLVGKFIAGETVKFDSEQTSEIIKTLTLIKKSASTELRMEIDNILKKTDSEIDVRYLIEQ